MPSIPNASHNFPDRNGPGETVATVRNLTVERGDSRVLQNVDLDLHAGQITAVMGRNGAGKSTLIRAMLGMLPIAKGHVSIAGRPIEHGQTGTLAGVVGYLPQDPARLLFAETVADELAASLKYVPRDVQRRASDDLLAELDLSHLTDRHPRDLSAGERERAALAAVLIGSPQLLMLDEPTRGMDGVRKHILMRILDRERSRGVAIVLATHDVELVAEWADRVILLGNGEVIADDHPRKVLAGSVTFSPQMNRLFGGGVLTVNDAIALLSSEEPTIP